MVIKFNPQGRVIMVFGRKQEASDEGTEPLKHPKPPLPPSMACFAKSPTWLGIPRCNTYISDGYVNSRVAKADKNGVWQKSWGEPGDQPGQFNTPHNIGVDARDNVYGRRPRQWPHSSLRHRWKIPASNHHRRSDQPQRTPCHRNRPTQNTGTMAPGAPWTICITPPPNQVLFTSDAFPGRIYKLSLDGKSSACLAKPASNSAISAGFTKWLAPPKTNST